MAKVPAWFDRRFEFTYSVDLYPNLSVRLRGTPPRLEEIVRDVSRGVLVRKLGDKWSAQEHVGHLLDLEPLWASRVDDFLRKGDTLTVADLRNRNTYEANHNARNLSEIVAKFRAARSHLLDRVGALPVEAFARTMLHPRLKQQMRLLDHLYFVAEHDDHHLAIIWELVGGGG